MGQDIYEVITSRRTIRAFERRPIPYESLKRYVNAGRLAPQAANRQPLEFIVVDDEKRSEEIFSHVHISGYADWKPDKDSAPSAYIVILANPAIQKSHWLPYDAAFAAANISLAAWGDGVGSCIIGAFNKEALKRLLGVPDNIEMMLVIALGWPKHASVVEERVGENMAYWRDEDGRFHVPKRPLDVVLHRNRYQR